MSIREVSKVKILQVVPYFPPAYAFGGPVKIAYQCSRELVKRGHEVVVYTTDAKNLDSRLDIEPLKVVDGIKVHYMRNLLLMPVKKSKLFITTEIDSRAKKEIKEFDVVHLHEYRTYQNIVIYRYAKKYGVSYVLQAHGSLPRTMAKQRLKWIYDALFGYKLLRDASKVIALSQTEAQQYRSMGVPEEKIAIIPNGIDLSEYGDLPAKGSFRRKQSIDDDEKIVLYLGRIHRIKGIDILLEAFSKVTKTLEKVKLVVVGPDDGYLGELEALIEALKMEDNVLILGPLYGRRKLETYVDADVYVLPSRYETFPMSVLEAVACGAPIILTEKCGIAEYFRDEVGLVVKPDPDHMYKALLEMLLDEDKQNAFRRKCRTLIKRFDISKTVSRLGEVYEEALSTGPEPPRTRPQELILKCIL
jgi:glycosyltransferase involved in cell wall biosynthesis